MLHNAILQNVAENGAMRLLNSFVNTQSTDPTPSRSSRQTEHSILPPPLPIPEQKSVESIRSSNEFGNSCRICRWNRSDMQISQCPCHCKGSVGFIHLQCLRRWIMHRRDSRCEICNEHFDLPTEKLDIKRMMKTFCTCCIGPIIKHTLYGASLIPLAHVVLQQVLHCMENINQSPHEELSLTEVLIASCALLTSSALFFHFFEFITTRFLLIRSILRQWWAFGNSSDFPILDLESDILDFF